MTLKRALLSVFGLVVLLGSVGSGEAQYRRHRCRNPYFRHHHPRYCHY